MAACLMSLSAFSVAFAAEGVPFETEGTPVENEDMANLLKERQCVDVQRRRAADSEACRECRKRCSAIDAILEAKKE